MISFKKKESIKSYVEWPKLAAFDDLKNRVVVDAVKYLGTYTSSVQTNPRTIPNYIFKGPYYEKQIFRNIYAQVKIFDITSKLQDGSAFVHRYFVY